MNRKVYGIPPEQVIGPMGKLAYEIIDGKPVLRKKPEVLLVDDKSGKPAGIQDDDCRRPIFAAGNSDGDFEMLEWTTADLVRTSPCLCITPTQNGSMPTTAILQLGVWTEPSTARAW
jgi:hypothetical protein